MLLSDLPCEILTLIANEVLSDETINSPFLGLCLSCKAVYTCIKPVLPRSALKWKFRNFSFSRRVKSTEGWAIRAPTQLMYEVTKNPEITKIMRLADFRCIAYHLELSNWRPSDDENEGQEDTTAQGSGGDNAGLKRWKEIDVRAELSSLVQANASLARLDIEPTTWLNQICEVVFDGSFRTSSRSNLLLSTVFLLTLFPKLETLAIDAEYISEETGFNDGSFQLLSWLVTWANENPGGEGLPLAKVREILPARGGGYEARASIDPLQPLLGLKSLEVFTQGSIVALEDGYTGDAQLQRVDHFPGIRELHLVDCIFGHDETWELTSRMPQLEIFRLSETVKWHGCGSMDWDPAELVRLLADASGDRLRVLSLTLASEMVDVETFITSFAGFSKLEDLELDLGLIRGHTARPGDNPIPLLQLLPPSIRRVRLVWEYYTSLPDSDQRLRDLFEGWDEELAAALPELKLVEFRDMRAPELLENASEVMDAKAESAKFLNALSKVSVLDGDDDGFELPSFLGWWPAWYEWENED